MVTIHVAQGPHFNTFVGYQTAFEVMIGTQISAADDPDDHPVAGSGPVGGIGGRSGHISGQGCGGGKSTSGTLLEITSGNQFIFFHNKTSYTNWHGRCVLPGYWRNC